MYRLSPTAKGERVHTAGHGKSEVPWKTVVLTGRFNRWMCFAPRWRGYRAAAAYVADYLMGLSIAGALSSPFMELARCLILLTGLILEERAYGCDKEDSSELPADLYGRCLFGRIEFDRAGFCVASMPFKPVGEPVEVIINADQTGPTEAQRELYREVEGRYEGLLEVIVDAITEEAQEEGLWKPQFSRESLRTDLRLDTISIDRQDEGDAKWDVTYWVNSIGHIIWRRLSSGIG